MAVLDSHNNTVVLRIVYDGAPLAGKTTSVGALARELNAHVFSPSELGGRTLYFDWMDYIGGFFEGRRIRCQVVSVPGQASLALRRRRLLESADAVVFVGDSTPESFDADRRYLTSLRKVLGEMRGPRVGIVLQANKRDRPDALPLQIMRTLLDEPGMNVAIVESVATQGVGVREAFVLAVHLALDRVRELIDAEQLENTQPQIDSGPELLEQLRCREGGTIDFDLSAERPNEVRPNVLARRVVKPVRSMRSHWPRDSHGQRAPAGEMRRPDTPDVHVPLGMIWPPIEGRVILQEIATSHVQLFRSASGDWSGVVNERWRIHTAADAVFATLEQGRPVLLQLARHYAARVRSPLIERCVALAADGQGRFRLWHIERLERSSNR